MFFWRLAGGKTDRVGNRQGGRNWNRHHLGLFSSLIRGTMPGQYKLFCEGRAMWAKYFLNRARIIGRSIFIITIFISLSVSAYGQTNGLAIGYGVGNLNPHDGFGRIPNNLGHEFLYLSYFHGFRLSQNGQFVLEPFVAYT